MPQLLEKISYEDLYTFDNFDVDSKNRFAYLAAKDVANSPEAMEYHINEVNPEANVVYTRGEDFYYAYLDDIRNSPINYPKKFRNKYRNADVLLMDDIDFFEGKYDISENYRDMLGELNNPVEEFFHTFETLYLKGKRIVLAANKKPQDLFELDEMFGKRFEMGLVVGVRTGY